MIEGEPSELIEIGSKEKKQSKDDLWSEQARWMREEGINTKRGSARLAFKRADELLVAIEKADTDDERVDLQNDLETCLAEIANHSLQDCLVREGNHASRVSPERVARIVSLKDAWVSRNYE